jgi:hypothetical protein
MICRHCQKVRSNRPRGLCWSCYYRPGVRDLYPVSPRFRKGDDRFADLGIPPFPTFAVPGSREKEAILAERARLGYQLWHPRDAGGMARLETSRGRDLKKRESAKRLSEEEKVRLRKLWARGERIKELQKLFGVSRTTVYLVVQKGKQTEPVSV